MTERQNGAAPDRTELMDAVVQLLNRQGQKLSPAELLGLLCLFNLLGIVCFLHREGNSSPPGLETVSALARNLTGKKTKEGGRESQELLHKLLGMVGTKGGQKLNPAALLTLVNLLGENDTKESPPEPPAKPTPKPGPKPADNGQQKREEDKIE